jgi:uracil phosphoribosyltransferase
LTNAIENNGFRGRQAVLASDVSPRLDATKLLLIQLTSNEFIDSVISRRSPRGSIDFIHATGSNAAKLLATPMRDAKFTGPVLREAHRRVGWYLATDFLARYVGVEEFPISHVQGHRATGHRLYHEQRTLIVALMRGGGPLALGVNDVFPRATLVEANRPEDIKARHLHGSVNVILVDSVINSGKTVAQFVEHIRRLHASVRLFVVAGVVQAGFASPSNLAQSFASHAKLSLVALRLSHNKFTGSGPTDTGDRLYNTTHLS